MKIGDAKLYRSRAVVVEQILDLLPVSQCIAVNAPRQGSKTTVLKAVEEQVKNKGGLSVYISAEALDEESFFEKTNKIMEISYERQFHEIFPKEVKEEVKRWGYLDMCHWFHQEKHIPRIVLLIDEAEYITEGFDIEFQTIIRADIEHNQINKLNVIFAGDRGKLFRKPQMTLGSPLKNKFSPLYIPPLTRKEAKSLLSLFKIKGKKADEIIERIQTESEKLTETILKDKRYELYGKEFVMERWGSLLYPGALRERATDPCSSLEEFYFQP